MKGKARAWEKCIISNIQVIWAIISNICSVYYKFLSITQIPFLDDSPNLISDLPNIYVSRQNFVSVQKYNLLIIQAPRKEKNVKKLCLLYIG